MVQGSESEDVLDCIAAMDAAAHESAVLAACQGYLDKFGFQSIVLGYMVNPASAVAGRNFQATNWPAEWYKRWRNNDFIIHDPIVRYALRAQGPFDWASAYETGSRFGKSILDESRNFGFSEGLAVPVRGSDGPPGCISIGAEKVDVSPRDLKCIMLATWHAYKRLEKLAGAGESWGLFELSRRETDVLQYAAAGKTNWEIGMILGIAEDTVRAQSKAGIRKLGCINREHAVAVAIQRGLILP